MNFVDVLPGHLFVCLCFIVTYQGTGNTFRNEFLNLRFSNKRLGVVYLVIPYQLRRIRS